MTDKCSVILCKPMRKLLPLATLAFASQMIAPASACVQSRGTKQVLFASAPINPRDNVVVLRVRVPVNADDRSMISAEVLDLAGDKVIDRISIRLDPDDIEPCYLYRLGVTGRPAYVMGVYEKAGNGPTYFRAYWLTAKWPSWRRPNDWRSYIVDPAIKAQAEARQP